MTMPTSGAVHCCAVTIISIAASAYIPAIAAPVAPPPLPAVSKQAVVQPGETAEERARIGRERSNVARNKKDFTKDDSQPGNAPVTTPAPAAGRAN